MSQAIGTADQESKLAAKRAERIRHFGKGRVTRAEMVKTINLALREYDGRRWHRRLIRRYRKIDRRLGVPVIALKLWIQQYLEAAWKAIRRH